MSNPYKLIGISVDTTGGSDLLPTNTLNVSPGLTEMVANVASSVYNNFTAVQQLDLSLSFTTNDLSVLETIDVVNGMELDSNTGVSVWFAKSLPKGTGTPPRFYDVNSAVRMKLDKGLGFVSSISGSGNDPIEVSVEFHGAWSGTGAYPLVISTANAPSTVPCIDDVYVPAYLNDVPIDSFDYQSGVDLFKHYTAGIHYPQFVGYNSITPTFNFTSTDAAILNIVKDSATDETFKDISNVELVLRRVKRNGTRYPEDEAEHIKIEIFEGLIRMDSSDGGHGSPSTFNITLNPTLPCGTSNSIIELTDSYVIDPIT